MDEKQPDRDDIERSDIIEPERMTDDEVAPAGAGPRIQYQQIFIRQTPDGAEYTKIESGPDGAGPTAMRTLLPKPPVWSTWICLFAAWVFLSSPVPFTIFVGLPLNLAALALALVCLARGGIGTGVLVLLLGTVGSFIVYLVGLLRFLS